MPEDAGKKTAIREFLHGVSKGVDFIEDIWIERDVREPGSGEGYCTAKSLSANKISNLTELLEDDLNHCFENGFFTFRFISAHPGSGKTSLLNYLHELIKIREKFNSHCLTSTTSLNDILSISGSNSFSVKLYSHILGDTFWNLLNLRNVRTDPTRDSLLKSRFTDGEIGELRGAISSDRDDFDFKWNQLIETKSMNFESFFFKVIRDISNADPQFTFVYLIDELDALMADASFASYARSFFRSLINRAFSPKENNGKIKLMIYLVGVSEDVARFLQEDIALESRVAPTRVDLVMGRTDEFEKIKLIITGRIKSAYQGCQDFSQAWQEINEIILSHGSDYRSLREFCQKYAWKVAAIHEKYFNSFDASYNLFENKARQLVETEARKKWSKYLSQKAYDLSISSTTSSIGGHAFDCYLELRHNGSCVARAFGEAKNYDLLSSHLTTFEKWLQDVNFNPDAACPELAFLIAPDSALLLQRKIQLKKIVFLQSDKVEDIIKPKVDIEPVDSNNKTNSNDDTEEDSQGIDINSATKKDITLAFKGTGVKSATIDKILKKRDDSKFDGLDDLFTKMTFTNAVREKLQEMQDKKKIWFSL